MTTGHAPDDWLDIPPPPFGPDGEGDGDGGDESDDGEMPTGEIQVVDVPDAEDAGDVGDAGEAPTGQIPVVDEPAPDAEQAPISVTMTGQFRAVAAALAADITANRAADQPEGTDEPAPPSDAEQEPVRLTMTGQFRAVAAELAADIAAGNGSRARNGEASPAWPDAATEARSDGPATPVDVEAGDGALPGDAGGRGATEAARGASTEARSDGRATPDGPLADDGAAPGEAGDRGARACPDAASGASSDGPATPVDVEAGDGALPGDAGRRGATEAAREASTEARSDGRAAPDGPLADDGAAPGEAGDRGARAWPDEASGASSDGEHTSDEVAGGGAQAREADGRAGPGDRETDGKDDGGVASGYAVAGLAGGANDDGVARGDEREAAVALAAPGDGSEIEAQAEDGARADVDVDGAVEVLEAPPGPKAWRVPVLRSKRDPERPPPPDALPAASEATMEVEGSAEVPPTVGGGGELGPRARRRIEAHRYRALRLRRQRRLAVAGLALLVTTGATLGIVGMGKVRGSTGGHYVDPQIRPDQPGYVALVTPTPTLLVINKDAAGALSGVSLLSLHAQDQGGSVIVMPVTTVAPFADAGTTFADAYAENGSEGVATQVELTLNITIGETVEVDDAHWATLVDPVAPITLDLDKAVGEWPAGEAAIPADDVGAFLTARTDSETELGRLDRQELFWETWLPLVKAGGRNAVPGEVDVGLGRFVRGLAAGDTNVTGLPVSAAFSAEEMYGPTEEMLPDLVAHAIPYPQEPSRGSRVQAQLLNGTTQRDLTARAATSLVAGGAEIALVGNAASFAEPATRFVYTDSKLRDDAEKLRDAFGVGEVVQSPADDDAPPVDEDRIDVTVILGADALDALGG